MSTGSNVPVSPVGTSNPDLIISAAAINNEPIELDATPMSSEQIRMSRRSSKAFALEAIEAEKGAYSAEREQREKLISERKEDPAVVVDVPQIPGADELEKSGAGEDEPRTHTGPTATTTTTTTTTTAAAASGHSSSS